MLRTTVKSLLARKLRLLLSGFAILLSVTFIAGTFVFTDTISVTFDALVNKVVSRVDVLVTPNTPSGQETQATIPASDVNKVRTTPGVGAAWPNIAVYNSNQARILGKDSKPYAGHQLQMVGNWSAGTPGKLSGRIPTSDTEAVISTKLATAGKFAIGDKVTIRDAEKRLTGFTIVGTFAPDTGDSDDEALGVFLTDRAAQLLLLDGADVYQDIYVKPSGSVTPTELRDRLQKVLPTGYKIQTGREALATQIKAIKSELSSIRYMLLGFVGLALFIGAFLIFNTFSIIVAQRLKELALLRAMGASRTQIRRSVLFEAVVTALIGSALGFAAGCGLGWLGAKWLASQATSLKLAPVRISPLAIGVSFGVGVLVTVLAALIPAIRASRIPPVAALRASEAPDRPLTKLTVTGLLMGMAGIGALAYGIKAVETEQMGLLWVFGGAAAILLGLALLIPILTKPLGGLIGRCFSWSTPGKLGRLNAARKPRRTAITAAAMMISIAVVAMFATAFASSSEQNNQRLAKNLKSDLVLESSGDVEGAITTDVITNIRKVPGVAAAVGESGFSVEIVGKDVWLGVSWFDDFDGAVQQSGQVAKKGRISHLRSGELVMSDSRASSLKYKIGDTIRLKTSRDVEASYTLVGTVGDNPMSRDMYVSYDDTLAKNARSRPNWEYYQVLVKAAAGTPATTLKSEVQKVLADNPEITISTRDEYIKRAADDNGFGMVMIQVMMGLAMLIAVLGVINTMALSVIERTRELGMLRAIGLRRRQTVRMIAVEAIVVSVLGAVVGLAAGVGLGAEIQIAQQGLVVVPWGTLVAYLIGAVLVGLLAAIGPAIRAVRLNVLAAVAYE